MKSSLFRFFRNASLHYHSGKNNRTIFGNLTLPSYSASFSSHPSSLTNISTDDFQNVLHQLSYGQPTHVSHPEFYKNPQYVIPGISKEELKDRRTRVGILATRYVQRTRGHDLSHIIVIPASSKKYMTENIPYPFRQNSNFLYLTGSYDPDAVLVITVSTNGNQTHSIFLTDPDQMSELWEGRKTSPDAAIQHLGLDKAYHLSSFDSYIRDFSLSSDRKFLLWCEDRSVVEKIRAHFISSTESQPVQTPKGILHSLRLIKSMGEIELMKKSAQIASEAFRSTISHCSQTINAGDPVSEHHIWAKLDYECRIRGAERLAYPPVVASGSRANIIHYVHNKNFCDKDDLCLVDAGCEYFGYCSDITRTFPVTGKFTNDYQRSLYELVLDIQLKVVQQVEPGMTLDQLFRSMGVIMLQGLQELGIIDKSTDISQKTTDLALRFCPHHVSHYLGLDVHDTSSIERHSALQPGMVITVEPGIYIQGTPGSQQEALLTKAGREFIGIGIRIEDDVLVTPDGQEVITAHCPKTVDEIEQCADQR